LEITEEEIARKMKMSREQFDSYLNAEGKTSREILEQLWMAYDDLFKAVQRSGRSAHLKDRIERLKKLAIDKGTRITDEEIREKIAIPREQFQAYLSGEIETPGEVLSLIWSTWPGLSRNGATVTFVQLYDVMEDDPDEEDE
jgi:DNA-directed RNA polymerase specialized sigma subunit